MATNGGPNITSNGLVFGYDTGYPLVSDNHESYKYFKGQPTETFDVGDMTPSSPNLFYSSSYEGGSTNLNGTLWKWYVYPNTNISTEGGMEWHPNVQGPGFTGAWLMKKRPGGNSESNFHGNPPGAIEETAPYTVSVWCKTDQANCFRIHINVTQNGSSYWGYSSTYHSGGGNWERLSVTVPANSGNTSINTIRCQGVGTTVTADAYFRNYQIEKNPHPTPFILGGTRSVSGSLIDLTRTTDIDLTNVSFDSNAQIDFDGTDDYIELNQNLSDLVGNTPSAITFEFIAKADNLTNQIGISGDYTGPSGTGFGIKRSSSNNKLEFRVYATGGIPRSTTDIPLGKYFYGACIWDGTGSGEHRIYFNGVLETIDTSAGTTWNHGNGNLRIGDIYSSMGVPGEWQGKIPIFRIYNRVLTASEVLQNYNALKSRFDL